MGQMFSRAGRLRRMTIGRKRKRERPDLALEAGQPHSDEEAGQPHSDEEAEQPHSDEEAEQPHSDEVASPMSQSEWGQRFEGPYQLFSKVMDLPLDLIATIFNFLETHDAVAFSIACKGLHHHFFPAARAQFKDASLEDKFKVQTMLEKDLPHDHVYCSFCKKFHSLDEDYRKAFCLEKNKTQSSTLVTYVPGKQVFTLKYLDARAEVNALLFGRPSVNNNLMVLDRSFISTPDNPWRQRWAARVIGGQLFLNVEAEHEHKMTTTTTITITTTTTRDKEEFAYSVCKHLHVHAKFPHIWINRSEVSRHARYTSRKKAMGTCSTCHADWKMNMDWIVGDDGASPRAGWRISIESWHRLGALRSPYDDQWARCAGEERSPKTEWTDGDSSHIIDNDGWERQMRQYGPGHEEFGPSEKIWNIAEEAVG